ncbi:MAG: glucosaminidase domain-containing protein [Bacteroidetes bacterium]|nr:glucosaminidase domain-containing protein [Bacteroidota bacterium]
MKTEYRLTFFFLLSFLSTLPAFSQNNGYDEAVKAYISKYSDIAVKEMMAYRIPASITLAQGIYESNAGRSNLATEANNHFGIKCHKEWTGKTFIQDDETKNECFRKYDNPEESFRDHSYFLAQRDRYKPLFNLEINDYIGWARGLKECGYATNPSYAEKLIKTIEDYQLNQFDVADFSIAFNDSAALSRDTVNHKAVPLSKYETFAEGPGKRMVYINNGLQFIISDKKDNIKIISKAFGVSERKIRKFNDMKPGAPLLPGQMVYLEEKKRKGAAAYHVVRTGETMYTISQSCGIQLERLYSLNDLKPGQTIKPGKKLLLR